MIIKRTLYNISTNKLGNIIINERGIAASLQLGGKFNGNLRKMGVIWVSFARLHFFAIAQTPLFTPAHGKHVKVTVQEVRQDMDEMEANKNFGSLAW